MQDILDMANRLGLMIKDTEACKEFERLAAAVEKDKDASSLLNKYNEIAETIQKKHESGAVVEKYEQEMFKALTETLRGNSLLVEYLKARERYMDLLVQIHKSMENAL